MQKIFKADVSSPQNHHESVQAINIRRNSHIGNHYVKNKLNKGDDKLLNESEILNNTSSVVVNKTFYNYAL